MSSYKSCRTIRKYAEKVGILLAVTSTLCPLNRKGMWANEKKGSERLCLFVLIPGLEK